MFPLPYLPNPDIQLPSSVKIFVSWFRTFVACLNQMFCRLVHKKFHIFPHFLFLNSNFHCCRCRRQRWHWERKQFRKSNSMAIIILIFTSVPINCTRNMVSTARVFSCITVWPIIYVDFPLSSAVKWFDRIKTPLVFRAFTSSVAAGNSLCRSSSHTKSLAGWHVNYYY